MPRSRSPERLLLRKSANEMLMVDPSKNPVCAPLFATSLVTGVKFQGLIEEPRLGRIGQYRCVLNQDRLVLG